MLGVFCALCSKLLHKVFACPRNTFGVCFSLPWVRNEFRISFIFDSIPLQLLSLFGIIYFWTRHALYLWSLSSLCILAITWNKDGISLENIVSCVHVFALLFVCFNVMNLCCRHPLAMFTRLCAHWCDTNSRKLHIFKYFICKRHLNVCTKQFTFLFLKVKWNLNRSSTNRTWERQIFISTERAEAQRNDTRHNCFLKSFFFLHLKCRHKNAFV